MSEELNTWLDTDAHEHITTVEFDDAIKALREAKAKTAASKKINDEDKAVSAAAEKVVMDLLKRSGKTEYVCDGYGRAKLSEKLSVQTPKTPEQKEAFFNWVKDEMGMDSYYAYMSVNSATLNRLYGEKSDEYAAKGEVLDINGIAAPTSYAKLSFTKA